MTEPKFTKGEWKLVIGTEDKDGDEKFPYFEIECDGERFMENRPYYPEFSDNIYDAYLIAASPAMYHALKIMTHLVRIKYGNINEHVNIEVDKALAVIEKAEGKAQ
jgi:hypothetical protein